MQNGREISLVMKVFDDGSGLDFEKEYGDYELNEVIDNWLSDNCVNHRFNKSDGTETTLIYDQREYLCIRRMDKLWIPIRLLAIWPAFSRLLLIIFQSRP